MWLLRVFQSYCKRNPERPATTWESQDPSGCLGALMFETIKVKPKLQWRACNRKLWSCWGCKILVEKNVQELRRYPYEALCKLSRISVHGCLKAIEAYITVLCILQARCGVIGFSTFPKRCPSWFHPSLHLCASLYNGNVAVSLCIGMRSVLHPSYI